MTPTTKLVVIDPERSRVAEVFGGDPEAEGLDVCLQVEQRPEQGFVELDLSKSDIEIE